MAPDQAGFDRQKRFDAQASAVGLDRLGTRATGAEIALVAKAADLILSGCSWAPTGSRADAG